MARTGGVILGRISAPRSIRARSVWDRFALTRIYVIVLPHCSVDAHYSVAAAVHLRRTHRYRAAAAENTSVSHGA